MKNLLNYLYFMRISLALWLVLPTLAVLDFAKITSSVTLGILTPETYSQLIYTGFFITVSGWLALTLARIVCAYGEERFTTRPPRLFAIDENMRPLTFVSAQIPGLILSARIAWNVHNEGLVPIPRLLVCLLSGGFLAFCFWVIIAILYYWTYPPQPVAPVDNAGEHGPPVESLVGDDRSSRVDDLAKAAPIAIKPAKAFLIPNSPYLDLAKLERLDNPPLAVVIRRIIHRLSSFGVGYRRPFPLLSKDESSKDYEIHSGHSIALFLFFGILALYVGLMNITAPVELPVVKWAVRSLIGLICLVVVLNLWVGGKRIIPEHALAWYNWLRYAAVGALILFAVVMFIQPESHKSFPVVASILVLFQFITLALAGLAFWADHYRIPVLTLTLGLITIFNLRPLRVDHQFQADAISRPQAMNPVKTPPEVLTALEPDGQVRPLIIVTATGGGIHSAMWTGEMLKLLETEFAQIPSDQSKYGFHDSILLFSTVSGGSVGAMSFLREYKDTDPFAQEEFKAHKEAEYQKKLKNRFVDTASCSSLEAVAWGVIYPDFIRFLAPGLFRIHLLPNSYDRGWALEEALRLDPTDGICHPDSWDNTTVLFDPTVSNLKPGELAPNPGELTLTPRKLLPGSYFPAFTFNATATETGDRFLLSNYQIGSVLEERADPTDPCSSKKNAHADTLPAESFLEAYGQPCKGDRSDRLYADLHLSAAARLSASFTYVSPAARIDPAFGRYGYHFIDGGYYDNDGTGSAMEFLHIIQERHSFPVGKVQPILLIEIRNGPDVKSSSSPDSYACQEDHCTTKSIPTPWGPWRQLAAPPQAMYLAGHESITRKNRNELCLLEDELKPTLKQPAYGKTSDGAMEGVAIHHVVFSINDQDAALSWHLTPFQIKTIDTFSQGHVPAKCQGDNCVKSTSDPSDNPKNGLEDAKNWFIKAHDPAKVQSDPTCQVYPR